jgi:16S rRNA (adenine1518-N6/adenine1519-N6)-dimethyltransferase
MTIGPLDVTALLHQYGLRPSKRLGQNFLQDESALQKIASIADIQPQDTVLEIGPGLGGLTRHLALAARQVVAVELDEGLFPALRVVLAPYANVRLFQGDILKLRPADLVAAPDYLVVANIPYYITSALLRHLLAKPPEGAEAPRPRRLVLTVQEEVAERICAGPGNMSMLALSVQVYGQAEIAARIPAGAFYPAPTVNSAVVLINIHPSPLIPYPLLDTFFWLAKAGFGQKRKTLRNALSAIMPREKAEQTLVAVGIDPQRRAETLRLEEWGKLSNQFSVTSRQ